MNRINLLDESTSNKIAAGEVVERPASVVKELLENSIDAGAKSIIIEIVDGGQKSIKIIDDGLGIHYEDIEKAFLSHATSKISKIDDIFKINTLGFRGEALASIASVSKTVLRSRTSELDYGREISIKGGSIEYIKDTGSNIGTTIEVMDLFYNVPARQKFLKSAQRETALISDIVERLALVNHHISFKFINNDKKVLTTYSSENITDIIRTVYGKSVYDNIIPFERHSDVVSVYGYIGNAEISRGSRNNQSIFVNKRYIKSKLITTAVENAFKSFLTINKFPFFIIFIDIFPEFVDVNVHPTKTEIKFSDDRSIFKLVFDGVHEAIAQSLKGSFEIALDEGSDGDNYGETDKAGINNFESKKINMVQIPIDFKETSHSFTLNRSYSEEEKSSINGLVNTEIFEPIQKGYADAGDKTSFIESSNAIYQDVSYKLPADTERIEDKSYHYENEGRGAFAKFPPLNIIGQFSSTYIMAEGPEGLYIIDQHAAHEKILFEKYTQEVVNRKVIIQPLITPMVIELNLEDYTTYRENENIFESAGFNIDVFGENTISIREVPIILGTADVRDLFHLMLENLKEMGSGEPEIVKYDKIAKLACKSAIKANKTLSNMEMKSLIDELRYINEPFTCPHGRPTIIRITENELEKRFKRIQ